jgi:signal transduction histidine kinase
VLDFRFAGTTFAATERVRFRYRLAGAAGAESDWRDPMRYRTVHYENLKPGIKYTFEVKAANFHNVWTPTPSRFEFIIEPHFYETPAFYVSCGLFLIGLTVAIQAYRLRWQRRLMRVEQQRALDSERTRIARDLHDEMGTALTGLGLQLDLLGRGVALGSTLSERLKAAAQSTRKLAERMREVVWAVNPKCDTVSSLASFLEQQVGQFLQGDKVRIHLDFPDDIPPMPLGADPRHQLSLCVREALNNILRHSKASEASVSLRLKEDVIEFEIMDNGCGMDVKTCNGNGLTNIKERLTSLGGSFVCESQPNIGTTLRFRLPVRDPSGKPRTRVSTLL